MNSSLGILHDRHLKDTEVPGTVQLLSRKRQDGEAADAYEQGLKRSGDIVLTPQPHDDPNDPLNWSQWRRDVMLVVIGFHSLVGGGQTPILAAGFSEVSQQFGVSTPKVAYTTGAYMFALGIGSVLAGPLASIYGKRVVYLAGQVIFCASCIWAALSPSYASLLAARIVEGFGVSPVECLPSSSLSEIYYLHQRAFRLGIYTMLLLGGKTIVPLVSATIINSFGWRWVFGIVAMIVAMNFVLTYFFVLETSWDRNVKPAPSLKTIIRRASMLPTTDLDASQHIADKSKDPEKVSLDRDELSNSSNQEQQASSEVVDDMPLASDTETLTSTAGPRVLESDAFSGSSLPATYSVGLGRDRSDLLRPHADLRRHIINRPGHPQNIPSYSDLASTARRLPVFQVPMSDIAGFKESQPIYIKKTWRQQLAITNGRLSPTPFWKIALRPFILFAYPAILYSTIIYSLSVVWLIVLSEALSQLFRPAPYHFSSLSIGLIYISPFIGGILGSAVAGKLSDVLTRYLSRRNNGIYEPEFRLLLAVPVAIVTSIGLMGFGWSTYVQDPWIAPTVFFGCISFGCSLGSTMSISFVVDSYKQHAGEALVTLNLTKNTLGFIFSLWFNDALTADGSRTIFLILGAVQIVACLFAIPLYIYGKRCRSWTYRSGMIDWLYE